MISVLDLPPVGVFLRLCCLSRPSVRERFKIRCEPFFFSSASRQGKRQQAGSAAGGGGGAGGGTLCLTNRRRT